MRYDDAIRTMQNPAGKRLLEIISTKKTNLCVSLDVTSGQQLLALADLLGPEVCLVKTHVDILEDFSDELIRDLLQLAGEHRFLIFEDRKFADIGHTVQLQYRQGIYHIAEWADFVNAHAMPGPGIVDALREVGEPQGRGVFLMAQMSSAGNLLDDAYAKAVYGWAKRYPNFVVGFIGRGQPAVPAGTLVLTPGVNLADAGDALGQQYITPDQAIAEGSDILIVGRGIIAAADPTAEARRYRQAGWQAYSQREGLETA
jgi:orotidine 5'-phosphate decarboxylase subfamily 1